MLTLSLLVQEEGSRPSPLLSPDQDADQGGATSPIYHPCRSLSTNLPSSFFCPPHCWESCTG